MEEVWRDLNLVPLNEGLSLNNNNNPPNTSNVGVHDFLGRSIHGDPQCRKNGESSRSFLGSHHSQMKQQQPQLGPVLNLNSSPGLEFLADSFDPLFMSSKSDQTMMIQPNPMSTVRVPQREDHHQQQPMNYDNSSPFQVLPSATRLTTTFGRTGLQENLAERRHKRRIKNRESAARSRARREAYTTELELEVSHLLAENAKLKKQHQKLRSAEVARRGVLQRTSTAPF